ncbi:MAG: carbohydrate ABC transporter permease [Spirochaetaceae bacterium]
MRLQAGGLQRGEGVAPYLFLLPFLIVLGIFFVYAGVRAIVFSFTDYNLFNDPSWVGLRNYAALFQERNFITALRNSILFTIVVTALQTLGALIMASVLNARIRGLHFFRAAYYMPSVASSVVITLIFLWMYQRRGLINYIATGVSRWAPVIGVFLGILVLLQIAQVLWERRRGFPARWLDPALFVVSLVGAVIVSVALGVAGIVTPREIAPIDFVWLQTRKAIPARPEALAMPIPLIAIMIQNIFTTIPTLMLLFLAGLQDVPKSFYEAASIDGASPAQKFFYITIPSLQPVLFLVLTLGLIGTLQMFDQVAIFGDAAPLRSRITLAYFVYNRMFPGAQLPEVGLASAAAIFLALFTLTVVLIQRVIVPSEVRR